MALRPWAGGIVAVVLLVLPAPSASSVASTEEQPVITTSTVSFDQGEFGSVPLEATPPHPYGDPCAYEWTVVSQQFGNLRMPAGLELGRLSARIRGTPTEYGEFQPLIRLSRAASTECGPQVVAEKRITVLVTPDHPVLVPATGSGGNINVVYRQPFAGSPWRVWGGTAPYSWTMTEATDLTIDPTSGEVTGTPSIAFVTDHFSITVTDAEERTSTRDVAVSYNHDVPDRTFRLLLGADADIALPLLWTTDPDTSPPVDDLRWSTPDAAPPGLTFTEGRVTGSPSTAGTFTMRATATGEVVHFESPDNIWSEVWTDTGTMTFVVEPRALRWTTEPTLAPGRRGRHLERELTTSDGLGRHTYRLVRGDPPPGTRLVRTGWRSLALRGTPTRVGLFEFRVRATDSRDVGRARTFEIRIRRG